MKKIFFVTIVLVLACPFVFADETTTKVIETKGQGVNREEAINKALKQAVAQVKGVAVSSLDTDFAYRSATADIDYKKDDAGKKVVFDAVAVNTGGTTLRTTTAGLVKTYEVLSEKKISDNIYEVTLKVWVYDYESPDKTSRLKLAVMPTRTISTSYLFGDLVTSSFDVSRQFSQKLAVALAETNKFAVLDREYIQEFAKERNILINDASLEEQAKLGEVLGVDYMLVGTITNAQIENKQRRSAATGRMVNECEADFTFEYRLLVGPTRQLKLADTFNISLEADEVRKLVDKWQPSALDYREMRDNFISRVANEIVETIIDRIYPIRIASISGNGQIIINQGGKRISHGLVLEVFADGEEIIDFDTKESLGKTEILIATIKIDKVMPKISYAKLVSGDLTKISKGLICRSKKVEEKVVEGAKSDVEKTPSGGVKLPFD